MFRSAVPRGPRAPRDGNNGRQNLLNRARGHGFNRVLIFPMLCLIGLVGFTTAGISGTSTALLQQFVEGGSAGSDDVVGQPQPIRSDEWLVNTPITVAQIQDGEPRVNQYFAGGSDVSLVFDVPYKDWSAAFRPQDLLFFVLPLANAFAFRWWFLSFLLVMSVYWVVLELVPRKTLLAASLGIATLFAPFVQWWYQAGTLLPLAAAFAILAFTARLLRGATKAQTIGCTIGIAYTGAVFSLGLYPPFQVPCALVALGAGAGLFYDCFSAMGIRVALTRAVPAALGLAGAGFVLGLFLVTRGSAVALINDTAYPGARVSAAGGGSVTQILGNFLGQRIRITGTAPAILGGNQSEGSAFIVVGLFLVGAQWVLSWRAKRSGLRQDWFGWGLQAIGLLFFVDLFVGRSGFLARISGLTLVPHVRLQIGIGMLAMLLIIATARDLDRLGRLPAWIVLASAGVAAAAYLHAGSTLHNVAPMFTGPLVTVLVFAGISASLVALLMIRPTLGGLGLAALSLYMSLGIHPLYRGLFSVRDTSLGRAIGEAAVQQPGAWVSNAGVYANAVLEESHVRTYSADFNYPQFANWKLLDPSGELKPLYNRYAHVVFSSSPQSPVISNPSPDVVQVYFDPCAAFAQKEVAHLLSLAPEKSDCLSLRQRVSAGGPEFYIYDVHASVNP